MPSSLILSGGAAFTRTIKETVSQTAHGFSGGDVLRWDTSATPRRYVKAQANNAINSEVVGVVGQRFTDDAFELVYSGIIDIPTFAGVSAAPVLFLSATQAGNVETSPPSTIGSVIKPIMTKNKDSSYVVNNFLGTQIGGSSTVAVDEIQPVGTIMPFAGSVIPDTWLPCNGGTYDRVDYPELYTKLCYTDGDQVPMYGYVAGLTGSGFAGVTVGDIVHFKATQGSDPWVGSGPYDQSSNDRIRAVVVALPSDSVRFLQVSVIPKFLNGKFTHTNNLFGTGNAANNTARYRIWQANGAVRSATAFAVTGVSLLQFKTPDLRGRFALGVNSVGLAENTNETDPTFISSLGIYSMGSLGGEEAHTLTGGEMPSHTHTATVNDNGHSHETLSSDSNNIGSSKFETNAGAGTNTNLNTAIATTGITVTNGATGANAPHNNMPPYTTVLYIIKAKPYTRAAIIDGVDIPYSSLLVRDLRSRNVGGPQGSNNNENDLVIYTNKNDFPADSGIGTERIRIKGNTGLVGIRKNNPIAELDVNGTGVFTRVGVGVSSVPTIAMDVNGTAAFNVVGIGTRSPASGVALDIVGEARSSVSTTASSNAKTLVTKDYVDSRKSLKFYFLPQTRLNRNIWYNLQSLGVPIGARIVRILAFVHTGQGPDYSYGSTRTLGSTTNNIANRRILNYAAALESGDNAGAGSIAELPCANYIGQNIQTELYLETAQSNRDWFYMDGYWIEE